MAKYILVKTSFPTDNEALDQSFCVLKTKLFKSIKKYIETELPARKSPFYIEIPGDTITFDTPNDIFGDDVIETFPISKDTAEELTMIFGLEFGNSSLLEVYAVLAESEEVTDEQ